jgi:hypothetical protein
MNKLFPLFAGLVLTACAQLQEDSRPLAERIESSSNPTRFQEASANIGKDFWLTGSIKLCPSPWKEKRACKTQYSSLAGKVSILSVTDDKTLLALGNRDVFYKISIDNKVGYVESGEFEGNTTNVDPSIKQREAAAECRRRGAPQIGMTINQAICR